MDVVYTFGSAFWLILSTGFTFAPAFFSVSGRGKVGGLFEGIIEDGFGIETTSMTYRLNGKQYVVIATGGHGMFGTKQGDSLVACSIP